MPKIKIDDIYNAASAIEKNIRATPLNFSSRLSAEIKGEIYLKCEQQQITGSFKVRGASNVVANLTGQQRAAGVVGVSTGNHGKGLARACKLAGIKCIICMSTLVPQNKRDGIKAEAAEIRLVGKSQDDAELEALRLANEEGMTFVSPFDDVHVIAGQGTLGLETFSQLPEIETAIIPLSGGGLLSGVATALKAKKPDVKIVGVTMERGAAMYQCVKAGKYVEVEELPTLADSLGGGIGENNRYTFEMVRDLVDEYVLVSETEIAEAIRHAYWHERQILEGSGSVAIASILSQKLKPKGKTVLFCCGGNIDMQLHNRIISGENVDVANEGN